MVATAVMPMATLVPRCSARLSALVSVEVPPRTRNEPEDRREHADAAMASGKTRSEMLASSLAASAPSARAKAASEIGAMIDPA